MRPSRVALGLGIGLAMTLGGLIFAQSTSRAGDEKGAPDGAEYKVAPEYKIGPEDALNIFVWKNETVSRSVSVRPDGKISLPLVGDIQAAGLVPDQLRAVLVKRLSEYMPSPEVAVIVTDVRSFKVSVIGEVVRPARYELKSSHTVLDVLALAGGFTQFAARSRIVILRPDGNGVRRIHFNYTKLASGGPFNAEDRENFYLRPGDIVLVP